jgi:hypothetical protein
MEPAVVHRTFDDVIDHITFGQPCNLMGADAIRHIMFPLNPIGAVDVAVLCNF